jgi:hypothetical protein
MMKLCRACLTRCDETNPPIYWSEEINEKNRVGIMHGNCIKISMEQFGREYYDENGEKL